ncbi:FAD:protein FMN transferase [Streptomyces sp. NPDC002787]
MAHPRPGRDGPRRRPPGPRLLRHGRHPHGGLATSGTAARRWRRGDHHLHHIVDPRTGRSATTPWRTVSVAAATCADANAAGTAALVKGESAVRWLSRLALPARLITHDGTVVTTQGWPDSARPAFEVYMSPRLLAPGGTPAGRIPRAAVKRAKRAAADCPVLALKLNAGDGQRRAS